MTRHANKPFIDRTTTSLQEMELWLGPSVRIGSTFSDDEQRRRLWVENRSRMMELFAHNGRRPQAWWKFEAPFKYPGFNLERSTLWAAGLLSTAEARELEQSWREEYNRSLELGFTFQGLSGFDAHIANLVFHDVPAELAETWAFRVPGSAAPVSSLGRKDVQRLCPRVALPADQEPLPMIFQLAHVYHPLLSAPPPKATVDKKCDPLLCAHFRTHAVQQNLLMMFQRRLSCVGQIGGHRFLRSVDNPW